MVCVVGFEPTASPFQTGSSTGLTYTQIKTLVDCAGIKPEWCDHAIGRSHLSSRESPQSVHYTFRPLRHPCSIYSEMRSNLIFFGPTSS